MPQEVIFLTLLVAQLWLAAVFSPVWKGGAVNVMLDFSKVLPLVIVIYAAVRSMSRLRWILFVQATCVAAIAIISIVNAHILRGRLQSVLSGIYGNPNDLALAIDLTLPLCLALALTTRRYLEEARMDPRDARDDLCSFSNCVSRVELSHLWLSHLYAFGSWVSRAVASTCSCLSQSHWLLFGSTAGALSDNGLSKRT